MRLLNPDLKQIIHRGEHTEGTVRFLKTEITDAIRLEESKGNLARFFDDGERGVYTLADQGYNCHISRVLDTLFSGKCNGVGTRNVRALESTDSRDISRLVSERRDFCFSSNGIIVPRNRLAASRNGVHHGAELYQDIVNLLISFGIPFISYYHRSLRLIASRLKDIDPAIRDIDPIFAYLVDPSSALVINKKIELKEGLDVHIIGEMPDALDRFVRTAHEAYEKFHSIAKSKNGNGANPDGQLLGQREQVKYDRQPLLFGNQ